MTRKGLYKALGTAFPRLTPDKLDLIFNTIGMLISKEISEGGHITIPGIGKFKPIYKRARKRYDLNNDGYKFEQDKVTIKYDPDRIVKRGADFMVKKIRAIKDER